MNRSEQTKLSHDDIKVEEQLIYNIDSEVINYFKNTIELSVIENSKKIIVPVIMSTAERWSQIDNNKIRDNNKKIMLPLCLIKRNDIEPLTDRYILHNEKNLITVYSDYSTENDYKKTESSIPTKMIIKATPPVSIKIGYTITLQSRYTSQINNMIEQIILHTHKGEFQTNNQYNLRWELSTISDSSNTDDFTDDLRIISSTFDFNVEGYIYSKYLGNNVTFKKIYTPAKIQIIERI